MDPASNDREKRATTVLITGAGGFVGRHLTAALTAAHPDWRLEAPASPDGAVSVDVTDAEAVDAWVEQVRPDRVVHLAAIAAVTASVKDPRLAWDVNLGGTLNLVLAMQRFTPGAHLLFVSSAEVYGDSIKGLHTVDEGALLQPLNPYAASKAAADILVRQAAAAGLAATVMRPFNHTGPGQSDAFVVPNFAGQIARIEAGLQPPLIEVGSLDEERDFLDVADVVAAYQLILEHPPEANAPNVFNVASGVAVRIGDLLDRLLSHAALKIEVRVDPGRLRSTPLRRIVGDASRLRALGWSPAKAVDDTILDVLEDRRRAFGLGR
ncbi:MAG TPA: GDP-mannose 4,6-dehydratase [Caulobacteraceae bacterium]|nr:GDP-mannose 4,6-dehydratase [Caulobacteraceae bacterium]